MSENQTIETEATNAASNQESQTEKKNSPNPQKKNLLISEELKIVTTMLLETLPYNFRTEKGIKLVDLLRAWADPRHCKVFDEAPKDTEKLPA